MPVVLYVRIRRVRRDMVRFLPSTEAVLCCHSELFILVYTVALLERYSIIFALTELSVRVDGEHRGDADLLSFARDARCYCVVTTETS